MASVGGSWLGDSWGGDLGCTCRCCRLNLRRLQVLCSLANSGNGPLYATGISHYGGVFYNSHNVTIRNALLSLGEGVGPGAAGGGGGCQGQRFRPPPGLEDVAPDPRAITRMVGPRPQRSVGIVPEVAKTTLMIRNLPRRLKMDKFVEVLDQSGFAEAYDFVYMPSDVGPNALRKYAYVNFGTPALAKRFEDEWHKSRRFGEASNSRISISAAVIQGFHDNAARWNSKRQEPGEVLILQPIGTDTDLDADTDADTATDTAPSSSVGAMASRQSSGHAASGTIHVTARSDDEFTYRGAN